MSSTGSSTRSSKVAPLILLKEPMYNSLVKCLSGWAVQAVTGKLWKRKFADTSSYCYLKDINKYCYIINLWTLPLQGRKKSDTFVKVTPVYPK